MEVSLDWCLCLHRSVFGRDTVKKMAQLQALMANLSSAAEGFATTYKVTSSER